MSSKENIKLEDNSISAQVPSLLSSLNELKRIVTTKINNTYPRSPQALKHLRIAIDEVLQNAYEHGNLEITQSDKLYFTENGTLKEELKTREAIFKSRNISLKIDFSPTLITVRIQDEGLGFDYSSIERGLVEINQSIDVSPTSHGLNLTNKLVDKMWFTNGGRCCHFIKTMTDETNSV